MPRTAAALAGLTFALAALASPPAADVPEALRAPAGERPLMSLHARGVQIYGCARGEDGRGKWTLQAPEAELRDAHGTVVAHHGAGPSWRYRDGSEVTGKAVAKAEAPDGQSIPWLLLSVVSHSGSGRLAAVSSIQRLHTRGGLAPAGACDPGDAQSEARVPYQADYVFYSAAG